MEWSVEMAKAIKWLIVYISWNVEICNIFVLCGWGGMTLGLFLFVIVNPNSELSEIKLKSNCIHCKLDMCYM